ncbi:hypothetical protein [Streptomyces carpinensis]|uniref:Uncharacterized protein n=1 Tax=Streptomyces carpinensis TaxID=66369 RepID=A0ABV1W1F4_9ACTN|nr:hypothetical protein [Streptomyces carpinensis]
MQGATNDEAVAAVERYGSAFVQYRVNAQRALRTGERLQADAQRRQPSVVVEGPGRRRAQAALLARARHESEDA